ncbi:MAG TPA: potassium channel family protein, partial [Thermoanaerobaculia bacterium]
VLLVFASLYFLFVFIGDFVDARESNSYYHTEVERMRQRPDHELRYRQVSERAFSGMSDRLWNGIEQRYGPLEDPRSGPPSPETILQQSRSAQSPFDFQAQNRLAVWFDCLHFSTVTIATLGYGDIIPKTWYAKLAADLEVLMGIVFVSLSLGRVLGGGENGA